MIMSFVDIIFFFLPIWMSFIPLLSLIWLLEIPMLNSNGESRCLFLVPDLSGKAFHQSFMIKHNISYGFLIDMFYHVGEVLLLACWVYHRKLLDFVKCFLCIYWDDLVGFFHYSNNHAGAHSLSLIRLSDPIDRSQVRLSMGFPRQEYWSGVSFPSPEIFPIWGLNPRLLYW